MIAEMPQLEEDLTLERIILTFIDSTHLSSMAEEELAMKEKVYAWPEEKEKMVRDTT